MVLSDVEETIYVVEVAEMTNESVVRVCFVFCFHSTSRTAAHERLVGTDCKEEL